MKTLVSGDSKLTIKIKHHSGFMEESLGGLSKQLSNVWGMQNEILLPNLGTFKPRIIALLRILAEHGGLHL